MAQCIEIDEIAHKREANILTVRRSLQLGVVLAVVLASGRVSPQIAVPLKLSQRLALVVAKIDGMDVPCCSTRGISHR